MLNFKKIIRANGFTLVELITAVAIMAILAGFMSVIFKSSIDGYRSAGANTEIMQKLRAITEQLNTDFEGFCKDGYLIIQKDQQREPRKVYPDLADAKKDFFMDRIYFFTTGDFQSWEQYINEYDTLTFAKSNIARVFLGHDSNSLSNDNITLSECSLARDVVLLTPQNPDITSITLPEDCRDLSFAQCKSLTDVNDLISFVEDSNNQYILDVSVEMDIEHGDIRRLFCENIGEFEITWSRGEIDSDGKFIWWPGNLGPNDSMPIAIKFAFTLYDSKRILKDGRRFTHIVYLGD